MKFIFGGHESGKNYSSYTPPIWMRLWHRFYWRYIWKDKNIETGEKQEGV